MKHSIPKVIVKLSALAILLCGCDKHSPQQEPAQPEQVVAIPESPVFFLGQNIDDVQRLLGEPNGTITVSNQTILLYGREELKFLDGRWINPQSDIRERIASGKKNAAKPAAAPTAASTAGEYSGLVSPGEITVVDFYATWCGPCKQMAPVLDEIIRKNPGVTLRKVDIGAWGSSVAKKYNITSVPNVRVCDKHGKMIGAPTSDPKQVAQYIAQAKQSK